MSGPAYDKTSASSPAKELRPVMLDYHDPVGPTILTFEGFEGHMAASGFTPEQIRGSWKHWPVVVFSEPDAD
jgi:hypothetical protein